MATDEKLYKSAKIFEKKYGDQIELAESIRVKKFGRLGEFTAHDVDALGRYLQTYEGFLPLLQEDATTRDVLGPVPQVGLDLVAIQYSTLPIHMISSIQPLEEEAGIIYYRRLVATETRAGVTAGDELGNAEGNLTISGLDDYYGEPSSTSTTTTAGTLTYNLTLNNPVRPGTVKIDYDNGAATGVDDGNGVLLSTGQFTGTVDYQTGALTITFNSAATVNGGETIAVTYDQNLIDSDNVPGYRWELKDKIVRATAHVVQTGYSTLSDLTIRKRFGHALADELVVDTVQQINAAVLARSIRTLNAAANANGVISWPSTPPTGISVTEHRTTFYDALEQAAQRMNDTTGLGTVTALVVSGQGRIVMRALGMKVESKQTVGPYFLGYFDGIPVIYAPSNIMPDASGGDGRVLAVYRGTSWYEAPVVYAPYLPVTTVEGSGKNVFQRKLGAAHMAAVELVGDKFVVGIDIV